VGDVMAVGAREKLGEAWVYLTRLGTEMGPSEDSRAIAASNRFYLLAIVANIPWLIVLAIVGGPTPAPVATHAAMMLTWVGGLWLNRLNMHLLGGVLALLTPLMQYAYLTDVYSRAAGFQLHLLAVPALSFAFFPARRWALRLGIGLLGGATLLAIYLVPAFAVPAPGISLSTVRLLAIGNVISTLVLLYSIAAFNNFFYQRERHRNEELLSEAQVAAQTDSLTEALNRRGIAPILASAMRQGPYALALVDLDRFKAINDALGHGAGDVILANVARSIARSIGDRGAVARWGGEEFLVVMPKCSLKQAVDIIEGVRAEIEDEYASDGVAAPVTISAGVAHGPQLSQKEELLRLADTKLYEAKDAGRNIVIGASISSLVRD
jgi:diguanylate cyclase (GGDEF)-like protein